MALNAIDANNQAHSVNVKRHQDIIHNLEKGITNAINRGEFNHSHKLMSPLRGRLEIHEHFSELGYFIQFWDTESDKPTIVISWDELSLSLARNSK